QREVSDDVVLGVLKLIRGDLLVPHTIKLSKDFGDGLGADLVAGFGGAKERPVLLQSGEGARHVVRIALFLADVEKKARAGSSTQDSISDKERSEVGGCPPDCQAADADVGLIGARPVDQVYGFLRASRWAWKMAGGSGSRLPAAEYVAQA